MTTEHRNDPGSTDLELNDQDLKALLERALEPERKVEVNVLRRVQNKLREESKGKFFGEGWSTTHYAPVATFLVTSLMIVAVLAITFALLLPIIPDPLP